LLLKDTWV